MMDADMREERLRTIFVVVIALGAIALALLPRLEWKAPSPPRLDLAAEAMPLPRPVVEPQAFLTGTPPLPASVQATLDHRRAFFAGEFVGLDAAMREAHDAYVSGRSGTHGAAAIVASIADTQLAGIDRCADWLRAMPDSYPAHWLCAAVWRSGAWAARSGRFAAHRGGPRRVRHAPTGRTRSARIRRARA